MSVSDLDLAALLCSRLCHDLLSPVGALNNGLELLADEKDPEMRARCFELLEQGAKASADKLKFFRLAFGAAGGFGAAVDNREPLELVQGLLTGNDRITLNWGLDQGTLPKPAVKVLLNLALVAIDALVRGGTLDIGAEGRAKETEIVVRAVGPRIVLDSGIEAALNGSLPTSELSSRTAAGWMTREMVVRAEGNLQLARAEDSLVIGAILPL